MAFKVICCNQSARSMVLQLLYVMLILMVLASLSHSMPLHSKEKQLAKSRRKELQCRNKCFMDYMSCETIVTVILEHRVCLSARNLCVGQCKLGLL